jgi:peptide/nickel transport system substrate-binding protein
MQRRALLKALGCGAAALSAPRLLRAETASVLRFVPLADLAVLDPVWAGARPTRNHAFLVFDTLYGLDDSLAVQPQMVAGHTVGDGGLLWTLTLRDGLRFHDGTPVLGRDAVASIRRFGARDSFGQALLAATDEVAAPSDRTIRFRLKRPFPQLPLALAGCTNQTPVIMPERLALTDPFKRVTEMVGSGPYRFLASEQLAGARVAYERFTGYVPRADGQASYLAGPKIAHFDRVEWIIIPDPATAAEALRSGEVDWWEMPTVDLLPMLARDRFIRLKQNEPANIGIMRFNQLQPPFDDPAIRRAVLGAVSQTDAMAAIAGDGKAQTQDRVGLFGQEMPLASDAGIAVLAGPRDFAKVRRELEAAGYKGAPVVLLDATDVPVIHGIAQVGADELRRAGMNVDVQSMDFGNIIARRMSKEPIDKGGWNVQFTFMDGVVTFNPWNNFALAANGAKAAFGWPSSERIEALRADWLQAADLDAQRRICRDLQLQLWQDVPYIPMGAYYQPTAMRADLTGVMKGTPQFHGIARSLS